MVTEEMIWEELRKVPDPELGINVVDLGLIYTVTLTQKDGGMDVHILMTLTSPACPLAGMFDELIGGAARKLTGVVGCFVELTFDPPWDMSKVSEAGKAELGYF